MDIGSLGKAVNWVDYQIRFSAIGDQSWSYNVLAGLNMFLVVFLVVGTRAGFRKGRKAVMVLIAPLSWALWRGLVAATPPPGPMLTALDLMIGLWAVYAVIILNETRSTGG
jgi:hypothetical protein